MSNALRLPRVPYLATLPSKMCVCVCFELAGASVSSFKATPRAPYLGQAVKGVELKIPYKHKLSEQNMFAKQKHFGIMQATYKNVYDLFLRAHLFIIDLGVFTI